MRCTPTASGCSNADCKARAGRGGAMARILIVDDDPAILEILDAYLSGEGYEVWQASDGHHARELMSRADLAILDWMLP
ncbi:response regulator transcription factor, partial [Deinococcus aerolatus]|uniref:response regulator transcription factor n=1 Tax=Deinococcus aerolatus TaxID=522487 RepID=UPI0027E472B1